MKAKLQALLDFIDQPHCTTLDRPTDFALQQSKSMRMGQVIQEIKKLIKELDSVQPVGEAVKRFEDGVELPCEHTICKFKANEKNPCIQI